MLRLTTKGVVRFSWADDAMEALFTLDPGDSQEELVGKLQRMLDFVQARQTPLPERWSGVALEMAQMTHPPLTPAVGNGWASMPPIPARLEGEVELIPPEEQS
ncbi:hypothetical protein ABZY09_30515 [Streptomyces sp. NPDC002928]|uniref:hypothetical protein n=1 Tax=Streptomyces sp. NPDC002928 TaxID=3154440 RepID=UPI0033A0C98C